MTMPGQHICTCVPKLQRVCCVTKLLLETYYSHASVRATKRYNDPDCGGECCFGQTSAPFQPDINYRTPLKIISGNKGQGAVEMKTQT